MTQLSLAVSNADRRPSRDPPDLHGMSVLWPRQFVASYLDVLHEDSPSR
jgi:hypothetical protein